jgi:hypothetical protein
MATVDRAGWLLSFVILSWGFFLNNLTLFLLKLTLAPFFCASVKLSLTSTHTHICTKMAVASGNDWQTFSSGLTTLDIRVIQGNSQTQGRPFILMDDIADVFPTILRLQNGSRVVGLMIDSQGHRYVHICHHLSVFSWHCKKKRADPLLPLRCPIESIDLSLYG